MQYTREQEEGLGAVMDGHSFKLIAKAGSGKTFFCKESARLLQHTSDPKVLYIVFNKSNELEAKRTFTSNVTPITFNAFAFGFASPEIQEKLSFSKEPPSFLAKRLNLKPGSFVNRNGRYVALSQTYMGRLLQKSLENYCISADLDISRKHIELPPGCDNDKAEDIRDRLYPHLVHLWNEQIDPNCNRGIIHEVYVKLFQLMKPKIEGCTILFDESQDLGPVVLDIMRDQPVPKIWVGDPFQSIYRWRGAINALDQIDLPEYHLSQSFRFGQNVGDLATSTLRLLKNEVPVRGLATRDTIVDFDGGGAAPDVYLCRTNAGAINVLAEALERGERTAIDSKEMLGFSNFAKNARVLMEGGQPQDHFFGTFKNWYDFQEFTESPYGSEYRTYVNLIREYGIDQLEKITQTVAPIDDCENIVTTVHRFKGMEAKKVQLCEFVNHQKDDAGLHIYTNADEIMLLYVALTRATEHLDVSVIRDELKMLLRGVRPQISEEISKGKGGVTNPGEQNATSTTHGEIDLSFLRSHVEQVRRMESKSVTSTLNF